MHALDNVVAKLIFAPDWTRDVGKVPMASTRFEPWETLGKRFDQSAVRTGAAVEQVLPGTKGITVFAYKRSLSQLPSLKTNDANTNSHLENQLTRCPVLVF